MAALSLAASRRTPSEALRRKGPGRGWGSSPSPGGRPRSRRPPGRASAQRGRRHGPALLGGKLGQRRRRSWTPTPSPAAGRGAPRALGGQVVAGVTGRVRGVGSPHAEGVDGDVPRDGQQPHRHRPAAGRRRRRSAGLGARPWATSSARAASPTIDRARPKTRAWCRRTTRWRRRGHPRRIRRGGRRRLPCASLGWYDRRATEDCPNPPTRSAVWSSMRKIGILTMVLLSSLFSRRRAAATTTVSRAARRLWRRRPSRSPDGQRPRHGVGRNDMEVELDDFYFGPTYIKATPGQQFTVELFNEGGQPHLHHRQPQHRRAVRGRREEDGVAHRSGQRHAGVLLPVPQGPRHAGRDLHRLTACRPSAD